MSIRLSERAALFATPSVRAYALREADLPALQEFFEHNPGYFLAVNGLPPRADEAAQEFHERPPAGMPYKHQTTIGFIDEGHTLVAMAVVVSDLLAPDVWHIGLFIVAEAWHGRGVAAALHGALVDWMQAGGARWVRLGVVEGNRKAERFWEKSGYVEVRKRHDVDTGARRNTIRVMVRPLGTDGLDAYLARVERDRPESTSR